MKRPKGMSDIRKGLGIKDLIEAFSSHGSGSEKTQGNSQLDVEKGTLEKQLEQFSRQTAQIEERLAEIARVMNRELPQTKEEPEEKPKEEESSMPEKGDDQKKKLELDFGLGKLTVNDIFQGLGSLVDFVAKMEQEGKKEEKREGEFTSPSGRIKGVYGFSVKQGIGGKPVVEPFGNVKKTPTGPVVEEEIQPLADVFDEKDHVLVIVELPGVEGKQIHAEVKGDVLVLSAAGKRRKYAGEVVLPKGVDASTLTNKYRNGVLEIRIKKEEYV
jgi:HSP20 family protein